MRVGACCGVVRWLVLRRGGAVVSLLKVSVSGVLRHFLWFVEWCERRRAGSVCAVSVGLRAIWVAPGSCNASCASLKVSFPASSAAPSVCCAAALARLDMLDELQFTRFA